MVLGHYARAISGTFVGSFSYSLKRFVVRNRGGFSFFDFEEISYFNYKDHIMTFLINGMPYKLKINKNDVVNFFVFLDKVAYRRCNKNTWVRLDDCNFFYQNEISFDLVLKSGVTILDCDSPNQLIKNGFIILG